MHLLYFVQYFPPENASGLSIVTEMIEGFVNNGWKVDVYVPTPTRGVTNEERKRYLKKRIEKLHDGQLTIHRMRLYREGSSFVQRTIRYSIFSLQCLVRGLFVSADAIFTGGAPPTQGIIGGIIHKLTSKKFIFNPQDLFPDSLVIAGQAKEGSFFVKTGRLMERFSYDSADTIITISEEMACKIRARTRSPQKIHVIRNWIDTKKIYPIERTNNRLCDELGLSKEKFYIVYAGNIGMMQGLETVVDTAELLKDNSDIEFLIFGNGSEEKRIQQRIVDKALNNIKMFPLQPANRVSEVYSLGNISLIPCRPGTGTAGMPSKTGTIMAAGQAIIGSFDTGGDLDKLLRDAKCGFCVEPGNCIKLSEAIVYLYNHPAETERLGINARKYAENNMDKSKSVAQYIKLIEQSSTQL